MKIQDSIQLKLVKVLAKENAVLDPEDAANLAYIIVESIPEIAAAQDLLVALKIIEYGNTLRGSIHTCPKCGGSDHTQHYSGCIVGEAIDKATKKT